MKTARKLTALLCALVLCVSLSVPAFAYTAEEQYDNLMAIVDLIRQVAVDSSMSDDPLARGLKTLFEEDPEAYEKLMSSMLSSYDRYSNYVPAGQYDVSYPSNASYVGVGVTLEQYGEDVRIAAVTEGGSAQKAGIQPGDILVSVNGTYTHGMTLDQVSPLLRGAEGTKVTVSIRRSTGGHTFVLERSYIQVSNFSSQVLEDGIYYMKWTRFAETTSYLQFVFAIKDMVENQCGVLILDLRGNPGGEVNMALNALNRLIPDEGKNFFAISSRQGEDKNIEVYKSEGMGPRLNKILILQDEGSASASEIVISSLCDLGYAESVGTTTYGKARGQYHLVFDDGSAVVITGLELIAPSTPDYDGIGLAPDHEVENTAEPHPAAQCDKVPERFLNITNWSEDTYKLNCALVALGLLDESQKADMYEFDQLTADALNAFRGYRGIAPQNYLDAQTAALINQQLTDMASQQVTADKQLQYALELAREYAKQPLQYTVDEYGNFTNLPQTEETPAPEETQSGETPAA